MLGKRLLWAGGIVLLLLAPRLLPEFTVTLLNYIGLYALVALGLVLLTGVGGLTSFGQAAFVGLGAYTTAVLTSASGLPPWLGWMQGSPWLALVAALLLTLTFAFVLGSMTLRLSGHYLPLGTIAWGISLYFIFGNLELVGGFTGMSGIGPISVAGIALDTGREIFYLIWLFLILAIVTTQNLLDSREGRAIRALKGGRLMAEAMGVDTSASRMVIFVVAALHACASGWLYAHMQRFVNPTPFSLNLGIEYLFMAVVGGAGQVWGALLGAAVITVAKQWLQDLLPKLIDASGNFEIIVFGIGMIVILQRSPEGLLPWLQRGVQWLLAQVKPQRTAMAQSVDVAPEANARAGSSLSQATSASPEGVVTPRLRSSASKTASASPHAVTAPRSHDPSEAALPAAPRPARGETLLVVHDVTRRFGGLVAVNAMSLEVKAGEIVALIGPNGAGKSTMFNLISGVLDPSGGSVQFRGVDVAGRDARTIAALGMSRTFQHVKLLPQMSVLDNVALGAHRRAYPGLLRGVLAGAWRLDRRAEAALLGEARAQIERVGLGAHLDEPAGSLPLGKQRILEIARALATDPCLLLLDEPAAGLRLLEKRALAELLRQLRADGLGVLLVEHDMDFVMGLVDRAVVMDFGQKIAQGQPDEVQRDPRVLEAYLGGVT